MDQIHIEISELKKKLLSGCVKIDTWISQSCYMDLSKLIHGFVKVATWINSRNWVSIVEYIFCRKLIKICMLDILI